MKLNQRLAVTEAFHLGLTFRDGINVGKCDLFTLKLAYVTKYRECVIDVTLLSFISISPWKHYIYDLFLILTVNNILRRYVFWKELSLLSLNLPKKISRYIIKFRQKPISFAVKFLHFLVHMWAEFMIFYLATMWKLLPI